MEKRAASCAKHVPPAAQPRQPRRSKGTPNVTWSRSNSRRQNHVFVAVVVSGLRGRRCALPRNPSRARLALLVAAAAHVPGDRTPLLHVSPRVRLLFRMRSLMLPGNVVVADVTISPSPSSRQPARSHAEQQANPRGDMKKRSAIPRHMRRRSNKQRQPRQRRRTQDCESSQYKKSKW